MALSPSERPLEVWRVQPDYSFQGIEFDLGGPGGYLERYPRSFAGEPMRANWSSWRAHITEPESPKGDFFAFLGGLGVRPSAMARVGSLLESTGELLPIEIDGEPTCHIFNCTRVSAEALDPERSTRRLLAGKWPMEPTKYAFRARALETLSVFKIPEDIGATLTVRGGGMPLEQDFYGLCQHWQLTGLRFECIWTDER